MRALLVAAFAVSSVVFAQGAKKQSFVPAAEPALARPKSPAPAPAFIHAPEPRATELMVHEKRLEMIRVLEELIALEKRGR